MVWLRKVKTSKGRPSATLAAAAAEPWPLYALMLVLPLEPVQPALTAFGFSFTWLEIAAGIALGLTGLGLVASRRLEQLWSSPLAGLALAFLAACLLSSAVAEPPRLLPFKFSLRVATGVAAFALASATLKRADRVERLLSYLALSGVVVALVGLAEAVGLAGVDAVLSIFRAQDFEVGGALRAASTFSYPNAAAGYLVLALPGMLLVALRQRQGRFLTRWAALGAAFLMFTALLLTYSRGALLGALVTPLPFWAWGRCRGRQDAARKASVILAGFLLLAVVVMIRPSFRLRAMSEGDETWYGAEFFPASTVLRLEAGELARTGVAIVNRGKMAWEPWGKKAFHLSYRWFDLSSRKVIDLVEIEGERTALPGKVEPGERVELLAYVRAPSREGRYLLTARTFSKVYGL
ncbi:MAG: O-antigen ligase family protein, partial [Acidobacteriota bacterium]